MEEPKDISSVIPSSRYTSMVPVNHSMEDLRIQTHCLVSHLEHLAAVVSSLESTEDTEDTEDTADTEEETVAIDDLLNDLERIPMTATVPEILSSVLASLKKKDSDP